MEECKDMAEGNLCVRGDLRGLLSVEHSGDFPCVLFGDQRACDAPAVRAAGPDGEAAGGDGGQKAAVAQDRMKNRFKKIRSHILVKNRIGKLSGLIRIISPYLLSTAIQPAFFILPENGCAIYQAFA